MDSLHVGTDPAAKPCGMRDPAPGGPKPQWDWCFRASLGEQGSVLRALGMQQGDGEGIAGSFCASPVPCRSCPEHGADVRCRGSWWQDSHSKAANTAGKWPRWSPRSGREGSQHGQLSALAGTSTAEQAELAAPAWQTQIQPCTEQQNAPPCTNSVGSCKTKVVLLEGCLILGQQGQCWKKQQRCRKAAPCPCCTIPSSDGAQPLPLGPGEYLSLANRF